MHRVISYSYWATRDEWRFTGPEGVVQVRTQPRIHANNGDTCRAAALDHQGIILQPDFLVGDDLRAGRLVELLPDYASLKKLAEALWQQDSAYHGAAVMVGAGFSRSAAIAGDATRKLPLWFHLSDKLQKQLSSSTADPLHMSVLSSVNSGGQGRSP